MFKNTALIFTVLKITVDEKNEWTQQTFNRSKSITETLEKVYHIFKTTQCFYC